jgi:hypothetical protein
MIASGAAEGLRISVEFGMNWVNRFLIRTVSRTPSDDSDSFYISVNAAQKGTRQMLTGAQQHAADRFAKSLLALGDDALIDTYHQAAEDHRAAQAEGSDNVVNSYEQKLASEKAMRDRFPDYQRRYELRYP